VTRPIWYPQKREITTFLIDINDAGCCHQKGLVENNGTEKWMKRLGNLELGMRAIENKENG